MNASFTILWLQVIAVWVMFTLMYRVCAKRDGRAPIDDIGIMFLLAMGIYITLPPVSWLLQGGEYSVLAGRLFQLQPDVKQMVYVMSLGLGYYTSFVIVYYLLQRNVPPPGEMKMVRIRNEQVFAAAVIVILTWLIMFLLFASGRIRGAESYVDSYLVIQQLPLALRQVIKLTNAFSAFATIIVTVTLFQRWKKYKWLLWIYLFMTVTSFNAEGGRTTIALNLLAMGICWHIFVRPIPTRVVMIGGFTGLFAFIALGIYRNIGSLTSGDFQSFQGMGVGEFDELWANAVELAQAKKMGWINIPFSTQYGEFFSFIPSQFLWFEKNSMSIWFLDNYYPELKELGGGLAFGAISQAAVGYGIAEALIRGALLALVAGWFLRWYRGSARTWWRFPLYLYTLIWFYQSLRDTSFTLLGTLIQTVLPAILVISLISYILKMARKTEG